MGRRWGAVTATVLGAILGWAAAFVVAVGYLTLVVWGAAGLALGYWLGREGALVGGALYGFVLSFGFMVAGYTGTASLVSRLPGFGLLGLVGALCGAGLAVAGALMRARFRRGDGSAEPPRS